MINLSDKQKEIIALDKGAFLVEASAGSGKTRILIERIKRLLESSEGKILAITFTNKAANELLERLGSLSKNKNIFVGTFHSFCLSILELRFKALGYIKMPHIFEDEIDRKELIKQAIYSIPNYKKKYDMLKDQEQNTYLYKILDFISTVKRELIMHEDFLNADYEEFYYLYKEYQDILKSNNAIDFDDVIKLIYELFNNNEALANLYRKSYSYICIDECQDLNKLQYFLIKSLCGNTINNIMMVGDPKQAIYGFNGSKTLYMSECFIKDFNAKKYSLDENYRCSKQIIEASNKLMNLNIPTQSFVIEGLFKIRAADSEKEEAKYVVKIIQELITQKKSEHIEGRIDYSKIAILARSKYVFAALEDKLKEENIPYYYKSGNHGIKFSSIYMKIFFLMFRIKINPLDQLHKNKLDEILKSQDSLLYEQVNSIVDDMNIENIHLQIDALRDLLIKSVKSDDEKNATINELLEFETQLYEYKKQNIKPTLQGFKAAIALGLININNYKEIGLCLSTVHTMKGQENDIVFLIGMDEGTFPDYRALEKKGEALEQEKNNLYVAFTRAKRLLFVSYPKKRTMPWGDIRERKISQFLKPFQFIVE